MKLAASVVLALALMTTAAAVPAAAAPTPSAAATRSTSATTTPIKHFLFLMQGGRTFDNYFGTYPGADGPPAGTCQPRVIARPQLGCIRYFPLRGQQITPLGATRSTVAAQYNQGKMNGFVSAYQRQSRSGTPAMGHYSQRQLAFYWNAASSYVLFDHFFSDTLYGIRSNRSYWVSAAPAPKHLQAISAPAYQRRPTIFDRLQAAGISWKFYVQDYNSRISYRPAVPETLQTQTARVPLLAFRRFAQDPVLRQHIVGLDQYYRDLAQGTLPAVAYIASSSLDNERSSRSIGAGQDLVRNLVTQLMQSRYWDSSALMWSYDSSGGWYDHMPPPHAGGQPLGFRVPALLVSAYARHGQVNHTMLDFTSALRFIEQNWRLRALTRRDAHAGSFVSAFDFAAGPRPALLIPAGPATLPGQPAVLPTPPTAAVYGLYGGAGLASIALIGLAMAWPRIAHRRRRRGAPAGGAGA